MLGLEARPEQSDPPIDPRRWALRHGAHLLGLWALAVLQPTLNVLSQGPDLFIARHIDGWPFVVVLVGYALIPPLVLLGLEWLAGLASAAWRWRLHMLIVWGLVALLGIQLLKQVRPAGGLELLAGGALIGLAGAIAYQRLDAIRSVADVLAIAPVVCLIVFLTTSPSKGLIFPASHSDVARSDTSHTPVVFLIFDELPESTLLDPSGSINARRFPNFARLSRSATWFRNDATAADETEDAIPALLSGRRTRPGQLPTVSDHPGNLFTLLGHHSIHAMEPATALCPPQLCPQQRSTVKRMGELASAMSIVSLHALLPDRWSGRLPPVGQTIGEAGISDSPKANLNPKDLSDTELDRRGGLQFGQFLRLIGRQGGRRAPPLYYMYAGLVHAPWIYTPRGKLYAPVKRDIPGLSSGVGGATWTDNPYVVAGELQRHILETAYADRELGRLVRRLKDAGLWKKALVVITADHGGSFRPGGTHREIHPYNAANISLVPLFIKAPGRRQGATVNGPVQSIDVLPTIAPMLGVHIPWQTDGTPQLGVGAKPRSSARVLRHQDGSILRFSFPRLIAERQRTLAREAAFLGAGPLSGRFYGIGPDHRLSGRNVRSLGEMPTLDATLNLEQSDDLQHVERSSPYVPAYLAGSVEGSDARRVRSVAICLNGRIAAVAPVDQSGDAAEIAEMVPENDLREGRNRVSALAVDRSGGLHRLPYAG